MTGHRVPTRVGTPPSPLRSLPDERPYCGWGRTGPSVGRGLRVGTTAEVAGAVTAAAADGGGRGILARGLGRSYGDAAQNGGGVVLDLSGLASLRLDRAGARVTAGAGLSLDELLRRTVPAGFFVPVTPGTRFVTVGGAVAADVHGKNHHVDGTFGSHVASLELVTADGRTRTLAPDDATAEAFWATVGGMGLTGVLTEATFSLVPITSSRMRVDTERAGDLDDLMSRMVEHDADHRYTVAWVDSVAGGAATGRGVITRGDHADAADLPGVDPESALAYDPRPRLAVPGIVPGGLLNRWTIRAFNEAWYRKAPARREGELQSIATFFHPLDGVADWNRAYGPAGFLQYQFVVPDEAADVVRLALERLRTAGAPSFLTVLKRFGAANPAPMSFPRPGWTLAADIPAAVPGLAAVLDGLDELVLSAGGRHYLAKDSRMAPETLAAGYPRLAEWRAVRDRLDPDGVFVSDQSRRLLT